MATLAELLPTMGEKTTFRGFSMGVMESTNKDDNGQAKTSHHFQVMCGTKLAKIKYDPAKLQASGFPDPGYFVQISCERGEYNGKPFYNNPGKALVLLNPDGTEPARAAR